eukprot:9503868-Pyramimonas_sp.AAC.2
MFIILPDHRRITEATRPHTTHHTPCVTRGTHQNGARGNTRASTRYPTCEQQTKAACGDPLRFAQRVVRSLRHLPWHRPAATSRHAGFWEFGNVEMGVLGVLGLRVSGLTATSRSSAPAASSCRERVLAMATLAITTAH